MVVGGAKIRLNDLYKRGCRWPRRLSRETAAVRLLGLRVRIPLVAFLSVSSECCVLSGKGHCEGPISRPEESYRVIV